MADGARFQQDVADRQVAMFIQFVGKGRYTTYAALTLSSGIPDSTLRSYAGGSAMPIHALLVLSQHLPAAAIDLLLEPAGKRLADAEQGDANWDEAAAATAMLTFEICEARSDGQIDHVERAKLRQRARSLAPLINRLGEEG